jgi:hypothetical protein
MWVMDPTNYLEKIFMFKSTFWSLLWVYVWLLLKDYVI